MKEQPAVYKKSFAQDNVLLQEKFSIHKGMSQIPIFFTVDQPLDAELMKKAVDIEIERNDTLRLHITKDKSGEDITQYFGEPYRYSDVYGEIPSVDFTGKTKKAQDKYIKKLANTSLPFDQFKLFRIVLFKTYDNKSGIYLSVSHMVCDAWGVFVTLTDLVDVYNALRLGKEMPKPLASFEKCLAKDIASRPEGKDAEDMKFYEDYYEKLGAPKKYTGVVDTRLPHKSREGKRAENAGLNTIKAILFDKSANITYRVPVEASRRWLQFCEENRISVAALLHFGLAAYLAKINDDNDCILSFCCNGRATVAEKTSAGIHVSSLLMRTIPEDEEKSIDVLNNIMAVHNLFFRHAGLPSKKVMTDGIEKKYPINSYNYYGSCMFSSILAPYALPEDWNCDFDVISPGHFAFPEYLMILPDLSNGSFKYSFEYQTAYLNEVQIKAQFKGMCDAIDACVADPNRTYRQIKNTIK